jgi:polysaccharide pyruvyl transferase WcaK-like protein
VSAGTLRIGLFGLLGAGNIGNDASMEALLSYLRSACPGATIDAMSTGDERVMAAYGVPAIPMHWHQRYERPGWQGRARQGAAWRGAASQASAAGPAATAVKAAGLGLGLVIDALRISAWVRRHDVVIVPGAGVLETSQHLRPWEDPYTMFLLCGAGRLCGTKVALVCVGANTTSKRLTRWLFTRGARMAYYRSYRDTMSRAAMRRQGVDTSRDSVYRDLVFSFPPASSGPDDMGTVGVGVMAYYGSNDERGHADQLHAAYMAGMRGFLRWLIDDGRRVRLFIGDTNGSDDSVVRELVADLREYRPDLDPGRVTTEPASSWTELARSMTPVGSVIAARYHNVLCALKLGKPTIAIGYSGKHQALMTDMGLSQFCQPAGSLDTEHLIRLFKELESQSTQLRETIADRNAVNAVLLDEQFRELTAVLLPQSGTTSGPDITHYVEHDA